MELRSLAMEQTMVDYPKFLEFVVCSRCAGPILAEPMTRIIFIEATLDYVHRTVWLCYACGKEHTDV